MPQTLELDEEIAQGDLTEEDVDSDEIEDDLEEKAYRYSELDASAKHTALVAALYDYELEGNTINECMTENVNSYAEALGLTGDVYFNVGYGYEYAVAAFEGYLHLDDLLHEPNQREDPPFRLQSPLY